MADNDNAPLVLLIDAARWARADTASLLRFAGYRTLEAGDGRSGLRLARERQPDIVLLELVLPKLSGLEVLVALQAAPARTPVIIVSTYARLIDRRWVAGAHQKPHGTLELLRDIERNLPAGRSSVDTAEEVPRAAPSPHAAAPRGRDSPADRRDRAVPAPDPRRSMTRADPRLRRSKTPCARRAGAELGMVLRFFYGGLVRRKNVLSMLMHSWFILALISVQWVLWGYTLASGPDTGQA